jgi:hypothetical protein
MPIRRSCLRVLVVSSAMALGACTPELNWREVRPEGSGLQVMFPCKPSTQVRTVALAGASVRMSMHACEAGKLTFALAHADVGDPVRNSSALSELRAALASKVHGTAEPRPLSLSGATPNAASGRWHVAGVLPDGQRREQDAVFFVKGTQVFQMVVMGPTRDDPASNTFFDSVNWPS